MKGILVIEGSGGIILFLKASGYISSTPLQPSFLDLTMGNNRRLMEFLISRTSIFSLSEVFH